jgi:catechol 2,3-dioxygenase-like lactoylglutathione lyase family enzyme
MGRPTVALLLTGALALPSACEAPDTARTESAMNTPAHFHGLRTAKYTAPDLARARDWYAAVLGFDPYFDQPFYVGFNVGGFELGIVPDSGAGSARSESGVAYWGVANADAAWKRLIAMGATPFEEVQDVGEGIRVGAVHDPFGNVLGIIENPHFQVTPLGAGRSDAR